ncbi:efflux RND transporter periplasmic adaptor subunit [Saccharospirillum mangrovi]|uniref:efflux RND transporter periplasmic adaptor subunit n=1 Tax=Saccharospirillum mangrovi TaxID=2161747 RepID=UPI000D3CCCDA|nr:efflux RND transporter periplasmic adaptor subunit [Saccharospirillum mangrovi]
MSDQHLDDKPEWAMSRREKRRADALRQGIKLPRRRWPWIVLAVVVVAIVLMMVLGGGDKADDTAAADADTSVLQLNPIEVGTAAPMLLRQSVRVTGTISPLATTQLSSRVNAPVAQVLVRAGDAVAAGDRLVIMETDDLNTQLEQQRANARSTEANLALARSQLARDRSLGERGLTPASSIESQRAQVAALEANLDAQQLAVRAAERALADAIVVAPTAGRIASRSVQVGQYVSTGTPLMTLVDLSSMEVSANVPLRAIDQIQPGQTALVQVDGISGERFNGTVDRVNPVAADGTRTAAVYVRVPNPQERLRGGMFASVEIVVAERAQGLAVPVDAVREDNQGQYVLTIDNGELVRTAVETGALWENGARLEITSGLYQGVSYIAAPLPELKAGDRVRLMETN